MISKIIGSILVIIPIVGLWYALSRTEGRKAATILLSIAIVITFMVVLGLKLIF